MAEWQKAGAAIKSLTEELGRTRGPVAPEGAEPRLLEAAGRIGAAMDRATEAARRVARRG